MVNSAYFVKSTPLKSFQCILLMHGRYVTDILKMCMKKKIDLHIAGGIL